MHFNSTLSLLVLANDSNGLAEDRDRGGNDWLDLAACFELNLAAVLRGQIKPDGDLSALDTNMVVMQILTAARESIKSGRTIDLKPLPQ